jgi:NhaP-type Na+/H+ or K+/H+ antiporter
VRAGEAQAGEVLTRRAADAAGPGHGREGLATAQLLFLDDKGLPLLLTAIAQALSTLAIGFVLLRLLRSALDRGAQIPRITRLAVLFGTAAVAVAARPAGRHDDPGARVRDGGRPEHRCGA